MMVSTFLGVAVLAVTAIPASAADAPYRRPGPTTSLLPEKHATRASVSADGRYVVFESTEPLLEGDTNGTRDIFVLDRGSQRVERVSVGSDGTQADAPSVQPHVTPDGRYVVFASEATTLVPNDTNDASDVFIRDRLTGITRIVSIASHGEQGNGQSFDPVVSADGRYVGFSSWADNLVPADTNGDADVFVRDVSDGLIERISITSSEGQAHGGFSYAAAISGDGRFVAFTSRATLAGPESTGRRAYVRDRVEGVTELVSLTSEGEPWYVAYTDLEGPSFQGPAVAMSEDGRYVAYEAVTGAPDRGGSTFCNVYVYDRQLRRTERVSISSDATDSQGSVVAESNALTMQPEGEKVRSRLLGISPDGRLVLFSSDMGLGYPGNPFWNLFVRNMATGETQVVMEGSGSVEGTGWYAASPFTADAREVVVGAGQGNIHLGAGLYARLLGGPVEVLPNFVVASGGGELQVQGDAAFWGVPMTDSGDDLEDVSYADGTDVGRAADLLGAEVLARPEQGDLLVRLDVDRLPPARGQGFITNCIRCPHPYRLIQWGVKAGPSGLPGLTWNLEMTVGGVRYQIRAAYPDQFALYRCDPVCVPQAQLRGGMGTAGHAIIVSVPSTLLQLSEVEVVSSVRAVTALASTTGEPLVELDDVDLPQFAWPGPPRVEAELSGGGLPSPSSAEAEVSEGAFSLTLPAPPEGTYQLNLRACLGQTCGPSVEREVEA